MPCSAGSLWPSHLHTVTQNEGFGMARAAPMSGSTTSAIYSVRKLEKSYGLPRERSLTPMTNPAVEALKPCPFCGGEVTWLDWHGVTIRHKSDLAGMKCVEVGDRWARKEDAIEAWNRRAQAEQTPVGGTGQEEWER